MSQPFYDCPVVGGGPAGFTAAIYLARFRRSVVVVDAGASRASLILESHNRSMLDPSAKTTMSSSMPRPFSKSSSPFIALADDLKTGISENTWGQSPNPKPHRNRDAIPMILISIDPGMADVRHTADRQHGEGSLSEM